MMEWIRCRRSVRTFDGRKLLPEDRARILEYAESAGNPYGIGISWKLLSAEDDRLSVPVIAGADTYIAGKMTRQPHAEEAFGYSFEKIVLYAESCGIGTTWIAGTMDRAGFERAMDLGENEVMPCVSPLGYPSDRMSVREMLMRKGIKADSRLDFAALFFERDFTVPLTEKRAGGLKNALEMVRLAPSAVNRQPWRVVLAEDAAHFYEKRNRGYASGDGWDIQKIDIGIAMCHFACGLEEAERPFEVVVRDPGISVPDGVRYVSTFVLR
ncbi:MAG: nitroreductase [Clostridia bacterium]|nr:nitroreductase [Clostridia bacterium]